MWVQIAAAFLQLLIDAGGDVNLSIHRCPRGNLSVNCDGEKRLSRPVFGALDCTACLALLLAQPALDLTVTNDEGYGVEAAALARHKPVSATMVQHEVSGGQRLSRKYVGPCAV